MSKRVVQFFLSAYKLLLPIKSYTRRQKNASNSLYKWSMHKNVTSYFTVRLRSKMVMLFNLRWAQILCHTRMEQACTNV